MAYKKITEVQETEQLQQEDSLVIVSEDQVKQVPVSNVKFGSEPVVYFYNTWEGYGEKVYRGIKEGNMYIKSDEEVTILDVQNDFLNSSVFIAGSNGTTSWDPTVQETPTQYLEKVTGTSYYANTSESSNWNLTIKYGNSGNTITIWNR